MSPASWPRDEPLNERLLVVDRGRARWDDARVGELARYLRAGDVLVVNDAATLPASLHATVRGSRIEVRLLAQETADARRWTAVLFGEGDWRTRTEDRPAPPRLQKGERLVFGAELAAQILAVDDASPRLVKIAFDRAGEALWSAIYLLGKPVQYAHIAAPLELWHTQTRYAGRPVAVELPSAGRPLTLDLLRSLERAGIPVATLSHAAGLSSTGDPRIDSLLPLPERYAIPQATVDAIEKADRVVAVGTTVVRALEGCVALHGALVAGEGVTDLRIDESFRPRVVDALFTGLHDPTASHFRLLSAFAPASLLEAAYAHATRSGYLNHEFGDSSLIA